MEYGMQVGEEERSKCYFNLVLSSLDNLLSSPQIHHYTAQLFLICCLQKCIIYGCSHVLTQMSGKIPRQRFKGNITPSLQFVVVFS